MITFFFYFINIGLYNRCPSLPVDFSFSHPITFSFLFTTFSYFFFLLFSIVFSWNLKKNPELYLSIRAKHINKIVQTGIIKMKYPIFGSFLTCLEYWVGNPEIKQVILFCFKSPICQMGIIITILYHDFFIGIKD